MEFVMMLFTVTLLMACLLLQGSGARGISCPNTMCVGRSDGNYAYPNNLHYFVSCVHELAYCRYCWPMRLEYNEYCDQCLHSARTTRCEPDIITGKLPSSWTAWSVYNSCSSTCGFGVQSRTRLCRLASGNCKGKAKQTKRCKVKDCEGLPKTNLPDLLQISISILKTFFEEIYPGTQLTGKHQRAMLQIQKAVSLESNLEEDQNVSLEERLKILIDIFMQAINSQNGPFTRETLGKLIYVFIKQKLKETINSIIIIKEGVNTLKKLRDDNMGIVNFDDVLAKAGDATLMFAMDTTGSMKAEIYAAQKIASNIVKSVKGHPIDCILSPFNDPVTGPVTRATSDNLQKCVTDIENLEATLGGDCPELAYKGMIDAIKEGPKFGSPMFVFTDANAKDSTPENIAMLKKLAEENAITINFLLTQSTCLLKNEEYANIATATNGQIFPLEEHELSNLITYVKSSLFIDTNIDIGRSDSAMKVFDVDSDIFLLMVTATVENRDTATYIKLINPDGDMIEPMQTLSTVRMYEITTPLAGRWSLSFPPNIVGNLTFNVEAISEKPIEFGYNFFVEVQERLFTVFHPIAGEDNTILLTLAGAKLVKSSSLSLDIIDELGVVLSKDISVQQTTGSTNTFNATFVPPAIPFKVVLRGEKKDDSKFQRVSRQLINVQSSFLQVAKAGNESTAKLKEKDVPIKIQVFNTGESSQYSFQISASFGKVSVESLTQVINGIGFIDFTYDAPTKRRFLNQVETISITATSLSAQKTIHYTFQMLIVQ